MKPGDSVVERRLFCVQGYPLMAGNTSDGFDQNREHVLGFFPLAG